MSPSVNCENSTQHILRRANNSDPYLLFSLFSSSLVGGLACLYSVYSSLTLPTEGT
ncbi:uncharacterized protein METZ01_LOCUS278184 [marine metagenome]|uniref:Uncharacterized protein n=1 Tax=marine metagenome TaxID=408172 RepID=A0A382KLH9_9ZZZZ